MALGFQQTGTNMSKNTQTTTDEMRFVCDNWDNQEVKLEGNGKGKAV